MSSAGHAPELIDETIAALRPIALSFVNCDGDFDAGSRMRFPCVDRWRDAAKVAASGDHAQLGRLIESDPELIRKDHRDSQRLLFEATRRGHFKSVKVLVDAGVDVNAPDHWQTEIMVTPWCIAMERRHRDIALCLEEHGARPDIFSAAYLGDRALIDRMLDAEPGLIDAHDPAADFMSVTPIYHAVWNKRFDAAKHLLERGATLGRNATVLLSKAAQHENVAMVRALLAHGASAHSIGPGRWVLNAELRQLLLAHGADVNTPQGAWIEYCTAHHGQRDEPELVAALLDCGAKLDAHAGGASALHKAVKAGHLGVLSLLIDRGANLAAEDRDGETPLFYIFRAGKSVDRLEVARLLLQNGADPNHSNHDGKTVFDHVERGRRFGQRRSASVAHAVFMSVLLRDVKINAPIR